MIRFATVLVFVADRKAVWVFGVLFRSDSARQNRTRDHRPAERFEPPEGLSADQPNENEAHAQKQQKEDRSEEPSNNSTRARKSHEGQVEHGPCLRRQEMFRTGKWAA